MAKMTHLAMELAEIAHVLHETIHDLHHIDALQAVVLTLAVATAIGLVASARAH
jgi:hypothetical protein